jgi:hypothetical protein
MGLPLRCEDVLRDDVETQALNIPGSVFAVKSP